MGIETFAPSPQDRVKLFVAPLEVMETFCASPSSAWLKLKCLALKLLQNLLCPAPFSMAKTSSTLFVGVKLHLNPS